jgi:hypothetical protein
VNQIRNDPAAEKWGTVAILPDDWQAAAAVPALAGLPVSSFTSERYVWTSPADVTADLPTGFTLSLRCLIHPDGSRRFYPLVSFEGLIAQAFEGGLALLCRHRNLSPEVRHHYRALWFLFRWVHRTREHLGNAFTHADSLRVTSSGRGITWEHSILPESVGRDQEGRGKSWCIGRLLAEGWQEATEKGIAHPTEADQIRHGLARAARLDPLYIEDREVPDLLRTALYETIELPEPLDAATREAVLERALEALHDHLEDPTPKFNAWFFGHHSSFVQQLAKQKRATGGVLGRDVVRRALLDLGWDAYTYVGDCVLMMMLAFQRRLPVPLTEAERRPFEQVYLKQPHFGQIPFVLLVERYGFLRGALWDFWERPGRDLIAETHRLLAYYGEMAANRRAVDRRVKAKRAGRGGPGRVPVECALDSEVVPPANGEKAGPLGEGSEDGTEPPDDPVGGRPRESAAQERWKKLAERVRELNNVRCPCELPEWVDRVEDPDADELAITHECRCGHSRVSRLSRAQLVAIAAAPPAD